MKPTQDTERRALSFEERSGQAKKCSRCEHQAKREQIKRAARRFPEGMREESSTSVRNTIGTRTQPKNSANLYRAVAAGLVPATALILCQSRAIGGTKNGLQEVHLASAADEFPVDNHLDPVFE